MLTYQHEYSVVGPVTEKEEAAAVVTVNRPQQQSYADERRMRMLLYRWQATRDQKPFLLAVLYYTFPNAHPSLCCWAVGRVVLLADEADRILDSFDATPHSFSKFTGIRFVKVNASNAEELMIGADCHYVGGMSVRSIVFDVADHKLKPLLSVDTIVLADLYTDNEEIHTLTLGERRTRLVNGTRFFSSGKCPSPMESTSTSRSRARFPIR